MNPIARDHNSVGDGVWSGHPRNEGGASNGVRSRRSASQSRSGTELGRAGVALTAASAVTLATEDPIETVGAGAELARSTGGTVLVVVGDFLNAPMFTVAPSFSTHQARRGRKEARGVPNEASRRSL